ncbi:MAG: signal peptide peptidase SppA [Phycisphaerae bacterium]
MNSCGSLNRLKWIVLTVVLALGWSQVRAEAPADEADVQTAVGSENPGEVQEQTQPARPARIAHMRIDGIINSAPADFSLFGDSSEMTLRDWLHRLAKARNDDSIEAVALQIDMPLLNWAQGQELADAIDRMAKVKPVHVHLTEAGAVQYLVASSATTVTCEPAGGLLIYGLAAEVTFFKDTLNWAGLTPQFVQIGKFKGAAEPLTRTEPSDELTSEYNRLLDGLYSQMCGQFAQARSLPLEDVRKAIDQGPFDARQARKHKFVDRLQSLHEWEQWVIQQQSSDQRDAEIVYRYGAKSSKGPDFSNPFALLSMLAGGGQGRAINQPTIAIVHVDGVIMMGTSGGGLFSSGGAGHETLIQALETARTEPNIKAVILRIDSPGGSALASELIYQAAARCNRDKPVIVSIGGMAASGGYYVAMGGRKIIADPAAIVGSIGVVAGKISAEGLMEKLKVQTTSFTRGANAGLALSRPWSQREIAVIRQHAEKTYKLFVDRVTESRRGQIADVSQVAQGRIFTAAQGQKLGMVDQLGGLRQAVIAAQKLSGVKTQNFIDLPRPRGLADLFGSSSGAISLPDPSGRLDAALLVGLLEKKPAIRYLLQLGQMMDGSTILTAMPHGLEIRR